MDKKQSALIDSLLRLIGWSNEFFAKDFSDDLLISDSGLTYQQAHPLITVNNLKSVAPQAVFSPDNNPPTWNATATYKKDDVVLYHDIMYRALTENHNVTPNSHHSDWVQTNYFSLWIRSKVQASIAKMLLRVVDERATEFKDKALVQNMPLQSNTFNRNEVVENKAKSYVGFELIPARYIGMGLTLSNIRVYTNSGIVNISDIPGAGLYLANSGTFITIENNEVNLADYLMTHNAGSAYLLYPQDFLTQHNKKALNTKHDWSKAPCRSCSELNYNYYSFWSKYLEVHPLRVTNVNTPSDIFDLNKFDYNSLVCYGLNFDIKIYCDIRSILMDNINELKSVLFYQVAVDLLYDMLYNPDVRTNRHAINASRNDIAAALEVTDPVGRKQGLKVKLDEAYKALHINLSGVSKVCLKCKNNGVKYRTV